MSVLMYIFITNIISIDFFFIYVYIGTSFVTVWALFLPKVEHSLYFHRNNKESTDNNKCEYQSNDITIPENAPVSLIYLYAL